MADSAHRARHCADICLVGLADLVNVASAIIGSSKLNFICGDYITVSVIRLTGKATSHRQGWQCGVPRSAEKDRAALLAGSVRRGGGAVVCVYTHAHNSRGVGPKSFGSRSMSGRCRASNQLSLRPIDGASNPHPFGEDRSSCDLRGRLWATGLNTIAIVSGVFTNHAFAALQFGCATSQ
jgi:hypothetical protein